MYVVETKSDKDISSANVKTKKVATLDYLDNINLLPAENRMNVEWKYVLLSENVFYTHYNNGATIEEILDYAIVSISEARGFHTLDNF